MARILLVEDEMLVRELAFEDLSEAGYEVVTAGDGEEALALLREDRRFDLLFTDIRMPGSVDGKALAAEGRQMIPGLKVIYASGLADAGPTDDAERALQKPYRREVLLRLLEDFGITP